MKTLDADLLTHLAGAVTTLATLWKITRTDGAVYGFCDHSADIVYGGVTYLATSGISASNITTSAALDVDNLEVHSVLSADTLTDADLLAGLWDFAAVEIFQINREDHSMGTLPLRSGTLGEVRTGRANFSAELRGLTQQLQQTIGRVYGVLCDADLGDTRCGVALAGFTVAGTVTAVSDAANFTASALAGAAGLYNYGKITFTGGANTGLAMEVRNHASGGVLTLQLPMPYAVAINDTFSIHPGCDKTIATCQATFSNIANHRGFPHVPGTDRLMSGT